MTFALMLFVGIVLIIIVIGFLVAVIGLLLTILGANRYKKTTEENKKGKNGMLTVGIVMFFLGTIAFAVPVGIFVGNKVSERNKINKWIEQVSADVDVIQNGNAYGFEYKNVRFVEWKNGESIFRLNDNVDVEDEPTFAVVYHENDRCDYFRVNNDNDYDIFVCPVMANRVYIPQDKETEILNYYSDPDSFICTVTVRQGDDDANPQSANVEIDKDLLDTLKDIRITGRSSELIFPDNWSRAWIIEYSYETSDHIIQDKVIMYYLEDMLIIEGEGQNAHWYRPPAEVCNRVYDLLRETGLGDQTGMI